MLLHPADIKGNSAKCKHLLCVQTNAQAQLSKEVLNHKRRGLEKGVGKKKKLGFTAQKTVPTWKVGEQPVTAERETIDEKKKKVKEH